MTWFGFAYITIKENVRKWGFYGVLIVYMASIIFSRLLMEFALQDLTKFLVDLAFSFMSFFLVLSTLFISTDVMNKDFEKKSIYIILSKGISRESYIFGRAFGFLVFTLVLTLTLGFIFLVFVKGFNTGIEQNYQKDIYILPTLVLLFILWLKAFLLSSIVIFFSSFMVTPFLIFLSSVVIYIAGSSIENLYYFVMLNEDKVSLLVKVVISILFYALPSFSSPGADLLIGMEKLALNRFILDVTKAILYSLMLLSVSVLILHKRELV